MFVYSGEIFSILRAVKQCNQVIQTDSFLNHVAQKGKFDMANCSSKEIERLIKKFTRGEFGKLYIETYKSKNPWSSAYGYYNPTKPSFIYLNTRKLNRTNASICATLIHEMVHFLDNNSDFSFGHGSNNPKGKQNTAPYWIDNHIENRLRLKYQDKSESFAYKIVTPWYYVLYNWLKWW